MPKSRRNKKRAGKLKDYKMKQGHKAFFYFDKVGIEIRESRAKAEIEEMQKIAKESSGQAYKDNSAKSIVSKILSPFQKKG